MADNTKNVYWYDRQRVDVNDMDVERDYMSNRIGNIFNRSLGDGVISGLAVSDDSEIINQNAQDAFYDIFLDTVGNRIIQIFKASSNNLQQLIVYGQRNGSAGNVLFSIYSLTDPTNPNSGISALVGQKVEPHTVFPLVAGEATVGFAGVAALTTAGSLTVDNYYALVIERDSAFGSIDLYYTTTNPYADGHIVEYDAGTGLFTTRATWDIYFKLYSDCVQISSGYAYQLGNPIEVPAYQYKVNLVDTSGVQNYICLKYYQILTDYETHPRTGQLVPSREQDYFQIVIRTNAGDIASDELLIAQVAHGGAWPLTVTDQRVFIPSDSTLWDSYTNKNVVLTGQTVDPALVVKDCVYYNTATSRWEKASFTNIPQGVYTASGEVTLFGQKTGLVGLTVGDIYMDINGNLTNTQTHIKIGYAINTTILLIDIDAMNLRSNTIVVAANDSTSKSKYGADYICDGIDDNIEIQAAIDYVNGLTTGGSVILMEGTYKITTNILPKSSVDIKGQGVATVLQRDIGTLIQILYIANTVSNILLSDFCVDGNRAIYPVAVTCYGILSQDSVYRNVKYVNIISKNNEATGGGTHACGFCNCTNLITCKSHDNHSSGIGGMPYSSGFESCYGVINCIADDNTADAGAGMGFYACFRCYGNTGTGNTTSLFNGSYFSSDASVGTAAGNGNA